MRTIYAPWERGDFSSVEWAHPEIEFVLEGGLEGGPWRGKAAMREAWSNFLNAWDHLQAEAEEYRALDDERVLVLTKNTGRGKTSGLELGQMQTRGANLFHIRDGKVTRLVAYTDRDRALADINLAAETDPRQT